MPNYHVTIYGPDEKAMADLVRKHQVTVVRQTLAAHDEGYTVTAIADQATINRLETAGYRVERHEDVDEAAKESLSQVGQGNRFYDQPGGTR
jgi:hypothetical protein